MSTRLLFSLGNHHCCFVHKVSTNTDHKPLLITFKKDIAILSHSLQRTLLRIPQYKTSILYMPGPQQFIEDWLLRHNHEKNRDKEIPDICITINTIESCMEIPDYMTGRELEWKCYMTSI